MTNAVARTDTAIERPAGVSVPAAAVRLEEHLQARKRGAQMKYALLAYSKGETPGERRAGEIHPAIAAVLDRPDVTGWIRLQPAESATTVRLQARKTLLTDGPFVDSKEFLGGLILIEADNLDGALAVAGELQELDTTAAIEVRPVLEQELGGA
jgi:hypothetical protein